MATHVDQPIGVWCLCDPYSPCSCDDPNDTDPTPFLRQVVANGSARDGIMTGEHVLLVNGTLPNGTLVNGTVLNVNAGWTLSPAVLDTKLLLLAIFTIGLAAFVL